MSVLDEGKKKIITAQMILARLVILEAPDAVTKPMRQWCRDLEKGKGTAFSESVSVDDAVEMEIVNVRGGKN